MDRKERIRNRSIIDTFDGLNERTTEMGIRKRFYARHEVGLNDYLK